MRLLVFLLLQVCCHATLIQYPGSSLYVVNNTLSVAFYAPRTTMEVYRCNIKYDEILRVDLSACTTNVNDLLWDLLAVYDPHESVCDEVWGRLFRNRCHIRKHHVPFLWMTSSVPVNVDYISGFALKWHNDVDIAQSMKALADDLRKVDVYGAFEAFQSLLPWAYKADIWRYAVLWRYGGVYMDHECTLTEELLYVVQNLTQQGSFHTCSDAGAVGGIPNKLWQGFLISEPGEEVILNALKIAIQNVKEKKYTHPLDITGPGVMRQAAPDFQPLCSKKGLQEGILVYEKSDSKFMYLDKHSKRSEYAKAVFLRKVYKSQ